MATAAEMPMPKERRAPHFEGDGRLLIAFLRDYRAFSDAALYDDRTAIERIVLYMTAKPRTLVERYDEYRTPTTWDAFRTRMIEDYVDAEAPSDFRRADYDDFVAKAMATTIRTTEKLGEFTREFRAFASDVKRAKAIHDEEVQKDYVDVLEKSLGQELVARLIAEHKDKRRSEWSVADTLKQAKIILKDAEAESKRRAGAAKPLAASPPAVASQVTVKVEDTTLTLLQRINARMDALERRNAPGRSPAPAAAVTATSAHAHVDSPGAAPPARYSNCYYCGGEHRIAQCSPLAEDIAAGRCIKNEQGRVVYPNGEAIRTSYGSTLRDKVMEFNRLHPEYAKRASAAATAMLVELGDSFFDDAHAKDGPPRFHIPEFESEDAEAAWYNVMMQHAYAYEKGRTVNGQSRRPGLRSGGPVQTSKNDAAKDANTGAAARAGPTRDRPPHFEATVDRIPPARDDAEERVPPAARFIAPGSAAAPPRRSVPAATIEEVPDEDAPRPVRTTKPAIAPAIAPRPQFKLQAPLEDEGLAKIINERILESKVVLSVQELLAISPYLRHHWKEQASTKRVVVGFAGAGEVTDGADVFNFRQEPAERSRDQITAEASMPLRYLDCLVGGFRAEGVVDNGSQLVIISQEFWEALGSPLDAQHRVNLTAANKTSNLTLGLCILPVVIAGLTFHLRVHVVEDAPFSLLLGRPFLALARATEDTRGDGSSFLTLNDNNTGRSVRIPTRARRSPRPESMPLDF